MLAETGELKGRRLAGSPQPEAVVIHLGWPADATPADLARKTRLLLKEQPLARHIYDQLPQSLASQPLASPRTAPPRTASRWAAVHEVAYLYTSFLILRRQRPAIFAQSEYYLAASSLVGWLAALALSGAVCLADVVDALGAGGPADGADTADDTGNADGIGIADGIDIADGAGIADGTGTDAADGTATALARSMDRLASSLGAPGTPIISPLGVPVHTRSDAAAATLAVFRAGLRIPGKPVFRIRLNGSCQILALGAAMTADQADAGPYQADVICVGSHPLRSAGKAPTRPSTSSRNAAS